MKNESIREEISKTTKAGGDEKITYTKRISKGDTSIEWTVKQVENGFVITKYATTDSKKGYSYDEKVYISKTNPLEKKVPELDLGSDLFNDIQLDL